MAPTTFTYENCELDFGHYSLGGDWTLTVSTNDDGFSFKLVDAESDGQGTDKEALPLIQKWIDNDTHPRARGSEHRSRIRAAYGAKTAKPLHDEEHPDNATPLWRSVRSAA